MLVAGDVFTLDHLKRLQALHADLAKIDVPDDETEAEPPSSASAA